MKDTRKVVRGIGVTEDGKYRVVTDTDTIAGMYSQSELDAFVESGVLEADNPGEWKSTKESPQDAEGAARDFSTMKVDELRALAGEKGIEGAADMKKADLVTALEAK